MVEKEEQAKQAEDFNRDTITLCPGLVIDNKIKFGTRLNIESKYKKPWNEINWNSAVNTVVLVYYLARQLQPDIKEDDVKKLLVEADMIEVENKLTLIFEQSLKKALVPEIVT